AGEEACLQCPLSYSTDVLQVMWQKLLPEEEVTVATCHPHRYKLNPDFSTKIRLKENCSIVVQNVTEQDEGCYLCLFITSSDVAYYGKACLHTYELHKPTLNVSRSISTGQLEVSCSATGRPAPNVTIHVQKTIRTHTNAVNNSNGTVTVIRTAALSPLHMNKTLECSATSSFGSERNRMTVPGERLVIISNIRFEIIQMYDSVYFPTIFFTQILKTLIDKKNPPQQKTVSFSPIPCHCYPSVPEYFCVLF
uniref:Ig-like domain-containing protein n=1 Tax=Neogobius melanostomus TaxID=47308 RepID=A0A8C6UA60_9GOBI